MLYSEPCNWEKIQTQVDNKMKLRVMVEGTQRHVHAKFGTCRGNSFKDVPFVDFSEVI